eukprot:SAG31_NODE_25758_length_454_cov_52.935211_1_plen_97_part_00
MGTCQPPQEPIHLPHGCSTGAKEEQPASDTGFQAWGRPLNPCGSTASSLLVFFLLLNLVYLGEGVWGIGVGASAAAVPAVKFTVYLAAARRLALYG